MNRCGSFPLLSAPHSLFSSEQTLKALKNPRSPSVEVRRVDLAKWALRISPKFITGVKYQFHQGFWPDQRFGNPNHPSPQMLLICTISMMQRSSQLSCNQTTFDIVRVQNQSLPQGIIAETWVLIRKLLWPPPWPGGNVVASCPESPGSIPTRVSFLVDVFTGFFPQL